MRLTYFGHASFLVETADGTRVILDPYRSGSFDGAVKYAPIGEEADVVIASHEHDDHGAVDTIGGDPLVLVHPSLATVGGLKITGVETAHDEAGGAKRGRNTVVCLDDGDVRLVHLGDLGHPLDATAIGAIGSVDVLIIPVGGFFTIDSKEAAEVVETLQPRIVIPIHFKTDSVDFPIAPVDDFLETQSGARCSDDSVLEVTAGTLPTSRETIVLAHCR